MPLEQLIEANKGRFTTKELADNIKVLKNGGHQDDPLVQKCLAMYTALYKQVNLA